MRNCLITIKNIENYIENVLEIKRYYIINDYIKQVVIIFVPIKSSFVRILIQNNILEKYSNPSVFYDIKYLKWYQGWFKKVKVIVPKHNKKG